MLNAVLSAVEESTSSVADFLHVIMSEQYKYKKWILKDMMKSVRKLMAFFFIVNLGMAHFLFDTCSESFEFFSMYLMMALLNITLIYIAEIRPMKQIGLDCINVLRTIIFCLFRGVLVMYLSPGSPAYMAFLLAIMMANSVAFYWSKWSNWLSSFALVAFSLTSYVISCHISLERITKGEKLSYLHLEDSTPYIKGYIPSMNDFPIYEKCMELLLIEVPLIFCGYIFSGTIEKQFVVSTTYEKDVEYERSVHNSKKIFIANLSNSMKTPLENIQKLSKFMEAQSNEMKSLLDTISNNYLKDYIDSYTESLEDIQKNCSFLQNIFFHPVESISVNKEYMNLTYQMRLIASTFRDKMITVSCETEPLWVKSDPTLLSQVLMSVLSYFANNTDSIIQLRCTISNFLQSNIDPSYLDMDYDTVIKIQCQKIGCGVDLAELHSLFKETLAQDECPVFNNYFASSQQGMLLVLAKRNLDLLEGRMEVECIDGVDIITVFIPVILRNTT